LPILRSADIHTRRIRLCTAKQAGSTRSGHRGPFGEEVDMVDSHGRFLWYELMTTDMEAAKAFYVDVVGWGTREAPLEGTPYTLFTAGGASVSGMMGFPDGARELGFRPTWLGYVGVNDVDAAADRIKQLGGAVHVSPRDVPNISRFAVAVDPQMATIAVVKWVDDSERRPAPPSTLGHVGWHELVAADWEKVWPFYAALFGWQKAEADTGAMGTYQLFSAEGETIGGMFTKRPTVPIPFWLYYFNVGDIDLAVQRVKAGGGHVVDGPIQVPGGRWIVQCVDPQGAIFALEGRRSHGGIGYFGRAG